jgi:hypothetical protein
VRHKLLIPVLFPACGCAWGQTAERRAEDLLSDCTKGPSAEGIACLAYLNGFATGIAAVQSIYTSNVKGTPITQVKVIRLPSEGISAEQTRKIAVKYLNDHPEQLHLSEMAEVLAALGTALPPCKKPE